jgi:hypothetical protein
MRAIGEFDPVWERDMIADAWTELAQWGPRKGREDAAERLFALNRGALPQNGIRLPAQVDAQGLTPGLVRSMCGALKGAGVAIVTRSDARYRFDLKADGNNGSVSVELYDGGRGTVIWSKVITAQGHGFEGKAEISRELYDGIYKVW